MNLNLYGHAEKWLIVDCGVTFDEVLDPPYRESTSSKDKLRRADIVAPDPDFIERNKSAICGMVITHGHEDHVGAVAYLWPRL